LVVLPGLDRRASWSEIELPTWGVALSVYSGWLGVTWCYRLLPLWAVIPLAAWLVAWHGSLQHEAVHGHPTRSRRANAIVAGAPLALWLPYGIYRESHLEHHRVEALTAPVQDPESYYVTRDAWRKMGPSARAVRWALATLAGRLVLGPPWMIARLWRDEARRILSGDHRRLRLWAAHAVLCALVLTWVVGVCKIPLSAYLSFFVYPGLSLTLLRSFAEHRPDGATRERSAIVETGPLLSLLFLNNNLHAIHHAEPRLPWYEIPARYRVSRAKVLRETGDYRFEGYLEVARRFALRPKDAPVHPEA
jgi:fatty acid desaturase